MSSLIDQILALCTKSKVSSQEIVTAVESYGPRPEKSIPLKPHQGDVAVEVGRDLAKSIVWAVEKITALRIATDAFYKRLSSKPRVSTGGPPPPFRLDANFKSANKTQAKEDLDTLKKWVAAHRDDSDTQVTEEGRAIVQKCDELLALL